MGVNLPQILRGQRPQIVAVLSLVGLTALAAGQLGSRPASAPARVGVSASVVTAKAAPAAGAQSAATTSAAAIRGVVANAPATPGWTSLINKGLLLQQGIATTDAPSAQPVSIAVSVRLRDMSGLQAFVKSARTPGNALYGQVLTTQQFNDTYAPTPAQAQAVSDYLANQGFRHISVAPNRAVISAMGTVGLAETAFNTHIVNFTWNGKQQYANTADVQVPNALGGVVLGVLGLTDIETFHLHHRVSPLTYQDPLPRVVTTPTTAGPAATHASGYTGPEYEAAYDANKLAPAYATTIGILTEGDDLSAVIPQLRLAERVNKQPIVPVRIVNAYSGGVPPPTTPAAENDGEWNLDSQASTGIAENVKELVYYNTGSLGGSDVLRAVNMFVAENKAQILNQSFGGCETVNSAVGTFANEQAYIQAVAQGQTVFTSTGDEGSACSLLINLGYPAGVPDAEYPSSSPNDVAVGGTTLSTDASYNYVSEMSWVGGGGGISMFFNPPKWQVDSGAVPSATVGDAAGGVTVSNSATTGEPDAEGGEGRGTPDVAMSGDPASGMAVYNAGAIEVIGGTSLSSPLSAGAYARIQTAHCNKLGFAAPLFYKLDTTTGPLSGATGFHDITSGTNGMYAATPGWDYNTGFGSFDIPLVNAALPKVACTPNQKPVAVLSANTVAGDPTLNVIVSGSSSHDPDGDAIVQYVMDYGDNTDLVIQSSPVFPAHAYTLVGNYVATLSVRDAAGNASLPVTQAITVYGVPQGCVAPGQQLITSPAGVTFGLVSEMAGTDGFAGQDDLRSVDFAEPAALTDKLVVTMKVANLTGGPTAGLRWVTYFNNPHDGLNYYVAMVSSDGASPVFNYGLHTFTTAGPESLTSFKVLGTLDATSNEKDDGTITLVLPKSAIGLKTGDVLNGISSSVRTSAADDTTGTTSAGDGLTQESGSATQTYTLVGNDVCKADIANPPAAPTPTPTPTSGTMTPPTSTGGSTPPPSSTGGSTPPPSSTGGSTPPPSSSTGGSSPAPTSTPTGSSPPATGISPVVVTSTGTASSNNTGRGGAGGALGWLVLGPLAATALRRRRGRTAAR